MELINVECRSEAETARIGVAMGESLEAGTVIGLNGTLGSGKTRLTQSIGTGLGIAAGQVVSPTFTICVPHEGRLLLLHLDAYRIGQPEEVDELGLDEQTDDGAVLIVEWAERIDRYLPPLDLIVSIEPAGDTVRKFQFDAKTDRGTRLLKKVQNICGPDDSAVD
jgi:tRNA threonylcarbamoyladenosine biosynthesis protein TsaE